MVQNTGVKNRCQSTRIKATKRTPKLYACELNGTVTFVLQAAKMGRLGGGGGGRQNRGKLGDNTLKR